MSIKTSLAFTKHNCMNFKVIRDFYSVLVKREILFTSLRSLLGVSKLCMVSKMISFIVLRTLFNFHHNLVLLGFCS
jgi:hypothetical protein